MKLSFLTLIYCLLTLIGSEIVAARTIYQTPMHRAHWTIDTSRLECSLEHAVEFFGKARFSHKAGKELRLVVRTNHPPRAPQIALLNSTPSAWGHTKKFRMVDDVEFFPEPEPLALDTQVAHRLLLELEMGKVPSFTFMDWQDGRDETEVRLSNVHFINAYSHFSACVDQLLDFGFEDVANTVVYFENDKFELTEGAKHRLKRVAQYLSAAPSTVSGIRLSGHTDSNHEEPYNIELSERRADAVNKALLAFGVNIAEFNVDWYGELEPVATNITENGRAQNRRVELLLIP